MTAALTHVVPALMAEASRGIGREVGSALRQEREEARAEAQREARRARAREQAEEQMRRRQASFSASSVGTELEEETQAESTTDTAPGALGSRCLICRTGAAALVQDMPCGHYGYCISCQGRRSMAPTFFRSGPTCAVCQAAVTEVCTALADAAADQQVRRASV